MNRRGETTPIQLVMGLVVAIAVVILIITIYVKFSDKTGDDIDSFNQCISRGAQAGGRGECSIDAACSDVVPKAGEYAAYLGLRCSGDQPGVSEGRTYCCIVIPRDRNPPAGTLAEGHIENNRKWCERNEEYTIGKASGKITTSTGDWCFLQGHSLLKIDAASGPAFTFRHFPRQTSGTCNVHINIERSAPSFEEYATAKSYPCTAVADTRIDLRDPEYGLDLPSGARGTVKIGYTEPGAAAQQLFVPFTIP